MSFIRREYPLAAILVTAVLFTVFGHGWLRDDVNPALAGIIFAWLFCFIVWGAINVVRHAPLTGAEQEAVVRYMRQSLGHPFQIAIRCVDEIHRSPRGKFEDFISYAV